ncbi:dGPFAETKE family protein [Mycobacterium xenopi 4042]|uniref:DGPFAETKE family protein n=1 Tax=Mycobacterium xenopi 4042 TaxID=1299334 RepID=X8CAP3_MYCXE|nr:dGPFAETKE family protein [Mycobacterium xenopi 4042]
MAAQRVDWGEPVHITDEELTMRYMMIMRSSAEAQEAAKNVPFDEILTAMGRYNESLIEAGVLLAGEGWPDRRKASSSTSARSRRPCATSRIPVSCSTGSGSSRSRRKKKRSGGRHAVRLGRG